MLALTVAVDAHATSAAPARATPSFSRIFVDNVAFVSRTLRAFGVREADLEDVCQEVFVTVHRRLPDFERRSSLRTWLYGIAWRTAANYRRRSRPAPAWREPAAVDEGPEAELTRRRARAQLLSLLDRLDEGKRAVFVLYEIEQLSMREVAEILGCPLQTAYSRHKAARSLVQAAASALELEGDQR